MKPDAAAKRGPPAHSDGPPDEQKSEEIVGSSARGVTYLILSQAFAKLLTFSMNQLLVRYVSPETYGVNAFLEFLVSTVLFFSREAARLSCQRIPGAEKEKEPPADAAAPPDTPHNGTELGAMQAVVNFSYLVPLTGNIILPAVFGYYWIYAPEVYQGTPFFHNALVLMGIAVELELFMEPLFSLNQYKLQFKRRAVFESCSITLRYAFNLAFLRVFATLGMNVAVLAFALGQLVYSSTLFLGYLIAFARDSGYPGVRLWPCRISVKSQPEGSFYLQQDVFAHWKRVWLQICLKHLLTEGDRLLTASFSSVTEQGVYSLVLNYGSLAARILFLPLEDATRSIVTKLLSSGSGDRKARVSTARNTLLLILRLYSYILLLLVLFAPKAIPFLLQLLVGAKWAATNAAQMLQIYMFYLPFLACNGVLEAFVQSAATGSQLLAQSRWMMGFTAVYISLAYVLLVPLDMGISGLIYSNMVNMALRIVWCSRFMKQYFTEAGVEPFRLSEFLPNATLTSAIAAAVAIEFVHGGAIDSFRTLGFLCGRAFLLVAFIAIQERRGLFRQLSRVF